MRYDTSTPPKMTISESSTHQTASRPVGMPMLARCVAMVFTLMASCPLVLGPVVGVAAGDRVLVRTAVHGRHLRPVAVRRRRVGRPLQRVRLPWVPQRLRAPDQAVDEVEQEHELEQQ